MGQFATGYAVMASLTNSGSLNAGFDIVVAAEATAVALASAIGAQQRVAGNDLHLSFDNTGSLAVDANLSIEAGSSAFGHAEVRGILQSAEGATGGALITNSGTIDVGITGDMTVTGSDASAILRAFAFGAEQQAVGELLQVVNHGEINAAVNLNAVAEDSNRLAYASGNAAGVNQFALGEAAKLSLINDGVIDVNVHAVASATMADGFALAWARAFGVQQANAATTAFLAFDNSGAIEAEAMATATALARQATALAIGYFSRGGGDVPAVVAVNNSGAISVAASGDAAGSTANPVEIGTLSGRLTLAVPLPMPWASTWTGSRVERRSQQRDAYQLRLDRCRREGRWRDDDDRYRDRNHGHDRHGR